MSACRVCRCLACECCEGCAERDETIERLTAERDRYKAALVEAADTLDAALAGSPDN